MDQTRADSSAPNPYQSPQSITPPAARPAPRLQRRPGAMFAAGILFGMLCGAVSGAIVFPMLIVAVEATETKDPGDKRIPADQFLFDVALFGGAIGSACGGVYGLVAGAFLGFVYGSVRHVERRRTFWISAVACAAGAACMAAASFFEITSPSEAPRSETSAILALFTLFGAAAGLACGVSTSYLVKITALRWRTQIDSDADSIAVR